MLRHGTAQHNLLKVTALQHQRVGRVLMRYTHHILLYDWSSVEVGSHIVARSTYNLHATLVCLMVRPSTDECWKERVVDVNDVVRILPDHVVAYYLHVARKHDERHLLLLQQFHLCLLHLCLVRVVFLYAPYVERNVELLRHIAQVFVVAHDARNLHFPLASLVTSQQVIQAVAHLAHEDCHSRLHVVEVEVERHLVSLRVKR